MTKGWPQCRQKRAPALAGLPQAGQEMSRVVRTVRRTGRHLRWHSDRQGKSWQLLPWQCTHERHCRPELVGEDKRSRGEERRETRGMDYDIMLQNLLLRAWLIHHERRIEAVA